MTAEEHQRTSGLPRAEARALLAFTLGVTREQLTAHPEAAVPTSAAAVYSALVRRRALGEPLAYLIGSQEFYGRPFAVTPDVLIPRPDTETLIEVALDCVRDRPGARVLELGTGSGCIAVTLKVERPDLKVLATDISAAALAVAQRNSAALAADVDFRLGDWYAAVPQEPFELIVSNPPYVAVADPHLDALLHEPTLALTDRGDGLACVGKVIDGAPARLASSGWLVVEHGYDQAEAVAQLMRSVGLKRLEATRDAMGHLRVTRGQI